MRLLILEDAPWIAALIRQVVLKVRPSAEIDVVGRLAEALPAARRQSYAAIVVDWNLPDGSGLEFLQALREHDGLTPVLMVTGRADRDSVLAVRRLGISAFIAKPFQVPRLVEALEAVLKVAEAPAPPAEDFLGYLAGLGAESLELPLLESTRARLLGRPAGDAPLDAEDLAAWQRDPALCVQLIAAANHGQQTTETPCLELGEALRRLGHAPCLELAGALALSQEPPAAADALLASLLAEQLDAAERLAERLAALAAECALDPAPLLSAARLHRLGELSVLGLARRWQARAGCLDEDALRRALEEFSQPFAVTLKARLGLPMALRELVGAVYTLPPRQARREQVLMRLAGAELAGEDAAVCERLRRLAGAG
ncbi:response regulator [Pseudomonas citronellolis]|uniref:response regulator n=1 Tax=Pseudomonas citronellolis TaxID=53408 RepID=UPI0023E38C12|nr:response regulator [Pseudomonas citronellolis]MDF3935794.1 response regulator [Pseudomonas citronellolis]